MSGRGQLATLAGASRLKGVVLVTDARGTTHRYADEESAELVWGPRSAQLEHRRGAFFETAPQSDGIEALDRWHPRRTDSSEGPEKAQQEARGLTPVLHKS